MTTWDSLPTLVRRSFEEYIRRFTAANPGAAPRRTSDPVRLDDGASWSVHFEDAVSGTKYMVLVGDHGEVSEAVQVA